jgi:hypothetical protein
LGGVAPQSQIAADMLLRRALPKPKISSNATGLRISTGSLLKAQQFVALNGGPGFPFTNAQFDCEAGEILRSHENLNA